MQLQHSVDPMGVSGAGMDSQSCPDLRQGYWAYVPHTAQSLDIGCPWGGHKLG